jgi:uncharacterized protein
VTLELSVLPGTFAVCRLAPGSPAPDWLPTQSLVSITWTPRETSIVCPASVVPPQLPCESGWRALEVAGPLDFALTGVLSSLLSPLAEAQIPVFVLSTYDTDYLLVRQAQLEHAVAVLSGAGHVLGSAGSAWNGGERQGGHAW